MLIYHPHSKEVLRLKGAGLVHHPNLESTALSSEGATIATIAQLTRLTTKLGLESSASIENMIAPVGDLRRLDRAKWVPIDAVREILQGVTSDAAAMANATRERKLMLREGRRLPHGSKPGRHGSTSMIASQPPRFWSSAYLTSSELFRALPVSNQ